MKVELKHIMPCRYQAKIYANKCTERKIHYTAGKMKTKHYIVRYKKVIRKSKIFSWIIITFASVSIRCWMAHKFRMAKCVFGSHMFWRARYIVESVWHATNIDTFHPYSEARWFSHRFYLFIRFWQHSFSFFSRKTKYLGMFISPFGFFFIFHLNLNVKYMRARNIIVNQSWIWIYNQNQMFNQK